MNLKFLLLSMTVISLGSAALPANAEGPRWDYAPNVYGQESHPQIRSHKYTAPHSVTPGAMRHSNVFAGVDPALLKPKPIVAPNPIQSVQAIVSVPQVQAAPFRNDFGAPISEQHAAPTRMAMNNPTNSPAPQQHIASANNVMGHLRTPRHATSQIAHAAPLPTIAGYGPGMGYQAGNPTPGSYGGGGRDTNTNVNGHIVGLGHH
jgi:hypothetical protein